MQYSISAINRQSDLKFNIGLSPILKLSNQFFYYTLSLYYYISSLHETLDRKTELLLLNEKEVIWINQYFCIYIWIC